jgi:DNA-binding response OmpR family regulator
VKPKILVVDDDKAMTTTITGILRQAGYQVLQAFDPIQALPLAQREQPRLILLDLNMPAGGGVNTLGRLSGSIKTNQIPVVIVTATKATEREAELRAHGAYAYIEKPVDPEVLLRTVAEVIEATTG